MTRPRNREIAAPEPIVKVSMASMEQSVDYLRSLPRTELSTVLRQAAAIRDHIGPGRVALCTVLEGLERIYVPITRAGRKRARGQF